VTDVLVLDQPDTAKVVLDPLRSRILHALATPGSASSVAEQLNLPRQKVNYHLRLLEAHGFIHLVEERPRRGLTERVMVASAAAYAVAPEALGACSTDPTSMNQLSGSYLVALGARLISEVGALARQAADAAKPLPTLAIDTEIKFASAQQRSDFAEELAAAVTDLVAKYHVHDAPAGRWHRLVIGAHPFAKKRTNP